MFLTGHVTLNYHFNKCKLVKNLSHCPAAEEATDHWKVSKFQNGLRCVSKFLHFCYHAIHQCNRTSKCHQRMSILAPGYMDLRLFSITLVTLSCSQDMNLQKELYPLFYANIPYFISAILIFIYRILFPLFYFPYVM